jgi:hypothetical protein
MGSMLVELFKKQKLGTPGIAGPVMRRGGIMKAKEGKSVLGEANKPPKIKLTGLGSVLGGKGGPAGRDAKSYRKYLKGLKAVGKFPGIRTAGALRQSMKDASKAGVKGFLERRAKLAGTTVKGMERAAKATRIGKIAAGVAGAALLGKAALEKMYEKRTGKKPFTKREPKRTLVDKKMGGGMMKKPMGYSKGMLFTMDDIIENMGKDYDYQTRIKYRKKSKGAPDQDSMKAYSEAEQDALKSVVKKYTGKMGGGMMRPMKAAGGAAIGAIAAGAGAIGAAALRANKKIADKAKEKKNKMRQEEFRNRGKVKRKMGGGMMMQRPMGYKEGSKGALKPTGIVLDAIRAYDKKQKPPKGSKKPGKMGGGMMMRPNPVGYKKGVLVKTKIGKNKPTKMY